MVPGLFEAKDASAFIICGVLGKNWDYRASEEHNGEEQFCHGDTSLGEARGFTRVNSE